VLPGTYTYDLQRRTHNPRDDSGPQEVSTTNTSFHDENQWSLSNNELNEMN